MAGECQWGCLAAGSAYILVLLSSFLKDSSLIFTVLNAVSPMKQVEFLNRCTLVELIRDLHTVRLVAPELLGDVVDSLLHLLSPDDFIDELKV